MEFLHPWDNAPKGPDIKTVQYGIFQLDSVVKEVKE